MTAINLIPSSAAFPPSAPASLQTAIPSYLYDEFNDDDDLGAFVAAYNTLTQIYVTWFNTINLPIYTGLSGPLLDWVGQGLYGKIRPTLYSDTPDTIGPLNSYPLNSNGLNEGVIVDNITNLAVTSDDIYKRILTWHFYKGDGKQVTIGWMKRRVLRFLYGINGADFTNPALNISIIIGRSQCAITIVSSLAKAGKSATLDSFALNSMALNSGATSSVNFPVPAAAPIFIEAINTGALEMPAQFNVTCLIGAIGVI